MDGVFDATIITEVRATLERVITEGFGDVYIDLREVTFMDSAAIGLIAFAFKRLFVADRQMILIGPNAQPKQLLELLRIDRIIDVRASLPADEISWSAPAEERAA
ncbi:MAG: STAS domain-containing protein [Rhodospirillales bacterium]|nr:STAS domain-containing protein [Rhodospirillales bacterium]